MKNKTIVNILAKAKMFNHEMFSGTPLIYIGESSTCVKETVNEYRTRKRKEYELWLEQEIEEE